MSTRTRIGKILKFNPSTWWGEIELLAPASGAVEFHATCYLGSSVQGLPKQGDKVRLTFSDESGQRLLSVSPYNEDGPSTRPSVSTTTA